MKKEVILVPKDKCPLDVLAEMGERIENAWIFLHSDDVENSYNNTCGFCINKGHGTLGAKDLIWEDDYPKIAVTIDALALPTEWHPIIQMSYADNIDYIMPSDPQEVLFLKMEEDE